LGAGAYAVACRRAEEASSQMMVRDWSSVAGAIARKTRKRPAFQLAAMFH
jgi:hypothetical protein